MVAATASIEAVTEMLLQLSSNLQQLKDGTKAPEEMLPSNTVPTHTHFHNTVSGPYMLRVKVVSIQWQLSIIYLQK